MKTLEKINNSDLKILNIKKINKTNRFSEMRTAEAIIESLYERDYEKNEFLQIVKGFNRPTVKLNSKSELVYERIKSDLLSPSDEPLEAAKQTIIFYDNRGKLESILNMENYNELILSGSANCKMSINDTEWLSSFLEQTNLFKNHSEAFCSETNMEEFCHYVDVTNEN